MKGTPFSLLLLALLTLFAGSACEREVIVPPRVDDVTPQIVDPSIGTYYLHLSHTRGVVNPEMAAFVRSIKFSDYSMLWLGGDLSWNTSVDDATMQHLDSIFQFRSPNTLWALGNHDYNNVQRIETFTGRPNYFTYSKNGITVLVLDTQDSYSSIVGAQKQLFDNVIDTLSASTHLVILHHKLIWMPQNPILEPLIPTTSNIGVANCFDCLNVNNFYTDIYPKLVAVKARGIEVICIGGDIGFNASEFDYETPEGIHFLASGISYGNPQNKALLFRHDLKHHTLTWSFRPLTKL
jgi:hypothetical protein